MHENAMRLTGLLWHVKQEKPLCLPLVIGNWCTKLPLGQLAVV
jgi:hypothetical protein